jgi:hypothetical protein
LFIEVIDYVVIGDDFFGKLRIRIHECIETFLENLLRRIRHDRQIDQAFEFRFLNQLPSAFRDVYRNVANAFDVLHNF